MRALRLIRITCKLVIATALFWVLFLAVVVLLSRMQGVFPHGDGILYALLLAYFATFPATIVVAWLERRWIALGLVRE